MANAKLPRMYLSGFRAISKGQDHSAQEADWIKRSGVKYRCMNFAYVCPGAFYYQPKIETTYKVTMKKGIGIMMDSSAFSFWMMLKKQTGKISSKKKALTDEEFLALRDKTIDDYVRFVKKDGKQWDWYANFDYIKDCDIVWEMQQLLERKGLRPAPIYHGDKSIDFFKRYCDLGYPIICLGSRPPKASRTYFAKKRFLERIFRVAEDYKVGIHGFAVTNLASVSDFPFYSVDSATWAKAAAYGLISVPDEDKNIIKTVHVSDRASTNHTSYNRMPKSIRKEIENLVDKHGFDFDKVRTNLFERCVFNAYVYSNLDKIVNMHSTISQWEAFIK